MATKNSKLLTLRLEQPIHQKLKLISVYENISMQKYLTNLIEKDLKRRERKNEKNQKEN